LAVENLQRKCEAIADHLPDLFKHGLGRQVNEQDYMPIPGFTGTVEVEQIAYAYDSILTRAEDDKDREAVPIWYRDVVSPQILTDASEIAARWHDALIRCERAADAAPTDTYRNQLLHGRGLMLCGPVGTGKTTLAASIVKDWLASGVKRTAQLWPTTDLMAALRSEAMSDTGDGIRYGCTSCGLLVLDDLGKERITDFSMEALFGIIDTRYQAKLPIIVTTQFRGRDLAARLSRGGDADTADAIISRLAEICDQVNLTGHDRRFKLVGGTK
jgi:hypothetical protein